MCKLSDKPLYASGFGIQLLAHFCAVGNRQLKVVNGENRGCEIQQLHRYSAEDYDKIDHVFMDNRTGDFW